MSRKITFGSIAEPMAPSRGALPVRRFHKKDESKIIPMKRLGIDVDDSVHIKLGNGTDEQCAET